MRTVSRVADLCAAKGRIKPKKLTALAEQAAAAPRAKMPWVAAALSELTQGERNGRLRGAAPGSTHCLSVFVFYKSRPQVIDGVRVRSDSCGVCLACRGESGQARELQGGC